MKVLALLLLLGVLALQTAAHDVDTELIQKFGKIKLMESCFGKQEVRKYKQKKKETYKMCKDKPVDYNLTAFYSGGSDPVVATWPEGEYRYFSEAKVRQLDQKMAEKISTKVCMLKEWGLMDANNELVYDKFIKDITDKQEISIKLRDDIIDGIQICQKITTCKPILKDRVPLSPQLQRMKTFMSCYKHRKFHSCFQKTLREKSHEFDFSAPEENDGVDEDDKILSLIWSKAFFGDLYKYD